MKKRGSYYNFCSLCPAVLLSRREAMTTLMESSNDHSLSLVLEVHCNRQSPFALGVVVVAVHHRRQYYCFDGEKSKKVVEEKRKTATVTGKEFGVDAHGTLALLGVKKSTC
jgi:hypothetical protein